MGLAKWFRNLGRRDDRFDPTITAGKIPSIIIRELKPNDVESCVDIYLKNEPGRFPEGYLEEFKRSIVSDSFLWLVVEDADQIVGIGGVCRDSQDATICHLSFGMIRPDRQGEGLGSALLLARLAALPEPQPSARVFMSSVDGSTRFFTRFGFTFFGRAPMDWRPMEFDIYYTVLSKPAWSACAAILSANKVIFDPTKLDVPGGPEQM